MKRLNKSIALRRRVPMAILGAATLMQIQSCKPKSTSSDAKNVAKNVTMDNIALVISGDKSGGIDQGVRADVQLMDAILPALGFKVVNNDASASTGSGQGTMDYGQNYGSYALDNVPTMKTDIKQISAQAAKAVANDGTLFWFITTHGSPQGDLSLSDGGGTMTTFGDVANAMYEARNKASFRRLVVFIEACFSGNNVNGATAISEKTGTNGNQGSNFGGGGNDANGMTSGGSGGVTNADNNYVMDPNNQDNQNQQSFFNTWSNNFNGQFGQAMPVPTQSMYNAQLPPCATPQPGYPGIMQNPYSTPQVGVGVLQKPYPTPAIPMGGPGQIPYQTPPCNPVVSNNDAITQTQPFALFEELILITSSSKSEYSYLEGGGSYAAQAFFDTAKSICGSVMQRESVTIKMFLDQFVAKASSMSGGKQRPVYKIKKTVNGLDQSQALANQKMFGPGECDRIVGIQNPTGGGSYNQGGGMQYNYQE